MNAPKHLSTSLIVLLTTLKTVNVIAAPIQITPFPPTDIPGGAQAASLQAAAEFAWQEFIALNWPAKSLVRDTPETNWRFGTPTPGPLVWHTFRAKNEIFPGTNSPGVLPHGYQQSGLGYNDPPQYVYATDRTREPVAIPACKAQQPVQSPAWINLDEISQLGLDSAFAGVVLPGATPNNSNPQLIRYMAKANRVESDYVVKNNFWYNNSDSSPQQVALTNFTNAIKNNQFPVQAPFISFPTATFEIKAAFRPLTAKEKNSQRFYTTTVRYYEPQVASQIPCYREDQWGLIGLHIIQKTPSAQDFVFATFEQADNLLTQVNGNTVPVEDPNGKVIYNSSTSTTPKLAYVDPVPPQTPEVTIISKAGPHKKTDPHLFYSTDPGNPGLPNGSINVNKRDNAIPQPIIDVNKAAHQAIANYSKKNQIKNSPWAYYKLVNVQAYPFNPADIGKYPNKPQATYYQANSVIETNYTLQNYNGRIASNGAPTKYAKYTETTPPNTLFKNAYTFKADGSLDSSYTMGGCMGCHGNAQVGGADFSFIIFGAPAAMPDAPSAPGSHSAKSFSFYDSLLK